MRPWLSSALTYGLLAPLAVAILALLLGLLPGVPTRAPLFVVSIVGAVLAFLSMWGDNAPTLASLPSGRMESLPVPWRMFLLGIGLFVISWLGMSLPL
jgi:hypothetical protein